MTDSRHSTTVSRLRKNEFHNFILRDRRFGQFIQVTYVVSAGRTNCLHPVSSQSFYFGVPLLGIEMCAERVLPIWVTSNLLDRCTDYVITHPWLRNLYGVVNRKLAQHSGNTCIFIPNHIFNLLCIFRYVIYSLRSCRLRGPLLILRISIHTWRSDFNRICRRGIDSCRNVLRGCVTTSIMSRNLLHNSEIIRIIAVQLCNCDTKIIQIAFSTSISNDIKTHKWVI